MSASYFGIWDLDYPIGLAWIESMGGIGLVVYCFLDRSLNADLGTMLTNVITVVVVTLLLVPIGALFDVMGWPLLNTWALSHGVFIVFLPLLLLAVFRLIRFARSNGKSPG
jgi:hypothetical protein